MLGLKRGTVELFPHETDWETEAGNTIKKLKSILSDVIIDIQHIGSTSIKTIKAKPIIDIAVGVRNFEAVMAYKCELESNGYYYRNSSVKNQLLFACGSYYDGTGDIQTHFIHFVIYNSEEWNDYINFRDFMNNNYNSAKKYELLKEKLAAEAPFDIGREKYTAGKNDFINNILKIAPKRKVIGKKIRIIVDRPLDSIHPKHKNIVYPVNYGYVEDIIADDGEEQDVYILWLNTPTDEFTGIVIAVIMRKDDVEDKWVAAPESKSFTREEIVKNTLFQEQFFNSEVIM